MGMIEADHDARLDNIFVEPRCRLGYPGNHRGRRYVGGRPDRHISESRPLVCRPRQTIVQSTQLGFRPGMDNAVSDDGICTVAHFALTGGICRASTGSGPPLRSARLKCGMVVDVLCCQQSAARPYQHHSANSGHRRNHRGFLPD